MSASYLDAAALREEDSSSSGSNVRKKVAQLSDKVVDSNPYSRLMCATLPSAGSDAFQRASQIHVLRRSTQMQNFKPKSWLHAGR